jgi:hypothetical protein
LASATSDVGLNVRLDATRVDPRAFLAAPYDDPQAVLDWAREHAPVFLVDDDTARRRAAARAETDAWWQLGVEGQRAARRAWRARYPGPYRGLPPRDCWPD